MENDKLTQEQEQIINDTAKEADPQSVEKLDEAMEAEIEEELEKIEAKPKETDYKEVFKDYDLDDDGAQDLLNLLLEYQQDNSIPVYDRLPEKARRLADGIRGESISNKRRMSKETAAKFILNNFINDAKFSAAINEYSEEMNRAMIESNNEYAAIYTDAIDEIYSRIDQIKAEDPEQAKKIEEIKSAFDRSLKFDLQKEWLSKINLKKLNKMLPRLNDDIFYLKSKFKGSDIQLPKIEEIPFILSIHVPDYDADIIHKFLLVLVNSVIDLDYSEIGNIAYAYKLFDNIYKYKFDMYGTSDSYKEYFDNVREVLNIIAEKK